MISDTENIPVFMLLIALLIGINAVVVLSNTALNNVNENKVKQLADGDNVAAKRVIGLLEKPFKYQYTNRLLNYIFLIVGITLTIEMPYNDAASAFVFLLVIATVGELFPRKIAVQHSEKISIALSGFQRFFDAFFSPFIWILTFVTDIFLKIFRQETKIEISKYSEEEVMSMLEAGQQRGEIKEEGKKMINSIFAFDDELAYEIMTPRTDVFLIDINDPPEEYLDELMELRYSRIPVCEDESDNIIGILHIKDYLIKARNDGFDNVDIRSILRKPYLVPETKNIDSLFYELQKEKQHIAILIDEYGGFSGIVTMEDIIEEVMGEIDDEYDKEELIISKVDDNTYYVNGKVYLSDLNEEINTKLESENSETIGGFIIDLLGEIPEEKDNNRVINYENYVFTILSVKERRIETLKLEIKQEVEPEEEEEE